MKIVITGDNGEVIFDKTIKGIAAVIFGEGTECHTLIQQATPAEVLYTAKTLDLIATKTMTSVVPQDNTKKE